MRNFIPQKEFGLLTLEELIKREIPYVFVAQEYNEDFKKVFKAIEDACINLGEYSINVLTIADLPGGDSIWGEVQKAIEHSYLGISDMSESTRGKFTNSNVAIETGMLIAQKKPVLLISTDVGASIQKKSDFRDKRWIQYSLKNLDELTEELRKHLSAVIRTRMSLVQLKEEKIKLQSSEDPESAELYYQKGLNLVSSDNFEEAIETYNKAIKLNPNNADFYFSKGCAFILLGEKEGRKEVKEKAIENFNKAIELNPDNYKFYYEKAELLREFKKFDEAIENYYNAIELKPEFGYFGLFEVYFNLGKAWKDLAEVIPFGLGSNERDKIFEKAIENYDKALEVSKHDDLALFHKGITLIRMHKDEEAIKCFDEILKRNNPGALISYSDFADSFYYKGILLSGSWPLRDEPDYLIKIAETIKCFDKSIEIKPNSKSYLFKAKILRYLEKFEEAIDCCDKAIELPAEGIEHAAAYGEKEEILKKLGRDEDAKKFSEETEGHYKLQSALHPDKYSGMRSANQGSFEEAIKIFDICIAQKPADIELYLEKGKVLRKLGRDEEAESCFKKVNDIYTLINKHIPEIGELWVKLAKFYYEIEKTEKADEALLNAEKAFLKAEKAWSWIMLGEFYYELKKIENAKKAFLNATKSSVEGVDIDAVWNRLGIIYFSQAKLEESEQAFTKATDIKPEEGAYWGNLGKVLFKQKKLDSAEKALEKALERTSQYDKNIFQYKELLKEIHG